jgi:hypothetical protein
MSYQWEAVSARPRFWRIALKVFYVLWGTATAYWLWTLPWDWSFLEIGARR